MDRTELPSKNTDYSQLSYWDSRFKNELTYDWLVRFKEIEDLLKECTSCNRNSRILIVGCGNSTLTKDMYEDGYKNLTSTDFSSVVIDSMRERHKDLSNVKWEIMDMTNITYSDNTFDLVIDKAALDAMVTAEGDIWDPDVAMIDSVNRMCLGISRVLVPGGIFLQISFTQPHFRLPYLTGQHASADYGWTIEKREIGNGIMPYFGYIMKKF